MESQYLSDRLPRSFYDRESPQVAQDLLGSYLVHQDEGGERVGKIVEVEAYLGPHDLAAHSSKGLTSRTKVLFGPPGHAYVYLIYGLYWCFNVVAGPEGSAAAVLVRALAPVLHLEGRAAGPGLLCKAMQIDRRLNGHDLVSDDLFIAAGRGDVGAEIVARPRIGIEYSGEWAALPLRYYLKGNPYVSKL